MKKFLIFQKSRIIPMQNNQQYSSVRELLVCFSWRTILTLGIDFTKYPDEWYNLDVKLRISVFTLQYRSYKSIFPF